MIKTSNACQDAVFLEVIKKWQKMVTNQPFKWKLTLTIQVPENKYNLKEILHSNKVKFIPVWNRKVEIKRIILSINNAVHCKIFGYFYFAPNFLFYPEWILVRLRMKFKTDSAFVYVRNVKYLNIKKLL